MIKDIIWIIIKIKGILGIILIIIEEVVIMIIEIITIEIILHIIDQAYLHQNLKIMHPQQR
jgi:hypothetical protein